MGHSNKAAKVHNIYLVTDDKVVYFGESPKSKRDITIEEYNAALRRIDDKELYPEIPLDARLTLALAHWDDITAYVKRLGLMVYESMKGTDFIPKELLNEMLIMERLSAAPHPSIVGYYGCRTRRGRITAIVLERLEYTLKQYIDTPKFAHLDKGKFCDAIDSAVAHLHSLRLAHNNINLYNIMVKDRQPALIDFRSC